MGWSCAAVAQEPRALPVGRAQVMNGMQRILNIYRRFRDDYPAQASNGSDATAACIDVVFLEWSSMYDEVITNYAPAESTGSTYQEFENAKTQAQLDFSQVFDVGRPHLEAAIRQALVKANADHVITTPLSLRYDNIDENNYVINLRYCGSQELAAALSTVDPVHEGGGWMSRLFHRDSM